MPRVESEEPTSEELPEGIVDSLSNGSSEPSLSRVPRVSVSRTELRERSIDVLNSLSSRDLLEFGITRISNITWLDVLGVPVWKASRPAAEVLSVNSGKGMRNGKASAGAIAEGIEFWAMEHPFGDTIISTYAMLQSQGIGVPPLEGLPISAHSPFNPSSTSIIWEPMTNAFDGKTCFVPSDLVWLKERCPPPGMQFTMFQSSSNGGAFGPTVDDALVTSIYELIERDAWTLFETVLFSSGKYPPKIDLSDAPEPIGEAVERIRINGATVFLFDVTTEVNVRVFGAYIFDDVDPSIGVFGGFGCSCDPQEAALRAILEACQSRCCYIDGARDDMVRRSFYLLKKSDHGATRKAIEELPYAGEMKAYLPVTFDSVTDELDWVCSRLSERGMTSLYWKPIWQGNLEGEDFCVVKSISCDLEPIRSPLWRPSQRVIDHVKSFLPTDDGGETADVT